MEVVDREGTGAEDLGMSSSANIQHGPASMDFVMCQCGREIDICMPAVQLIEASSILKYRYQEVRQGGGQAAAPPAPVGGGMESKEEPGPGETKDDPPGGDRSEDVALQEAAQLHEKVRGLRQELEDYVAADKADLAKLVDRQIDKAAARLRELRELGAPAAVVQAAAPTPAETGLREELADLTRKLEIFERRQNATSGADAVVNEHMRKRHLSLLETRIGFERIVEILDATLGSLKSSDGRGDAVTRLEVALGVAREGAKQQGEAAESVWVADRAMMRGLSEAQAWEFVDSWEYYMGCANDLEKAKPITQRFLAAFKEYEKVFKKRDNDGNDSSVPPDGFQRTQGDRRGKCFICGQSGHYARECPRLAQGEGGGAKKRKTKE